MNMKEISKVVDLVREFNLFVYNIINVVVINFIVNGLLVFGVLFVMVYVKEEVVEMVSIVGVLVLNMGIFCFEEVEVMLFVGKLVNVNNVLVLFDLVGVGVILYWIEVVRYILVEIELVSICGNVVEIVNVINERWEIKGVDVGIGNGNVVSIVR